MLSEAERAHLDERGFVVLEDAISADHADALRDRSMALARRERGTPGEFVYLEDKAQRVWNLVDKGEVFEQAIQHPRVLGAMTWLLGADCTLSSFTVNVIGPGAPDGGLHIDHPLGTHADAPSGVPAVRKQHLVPRRLHGPERRHALRSRQSPPARSAAGAGRAL